MLWLNTEHLQLVPVWQWTPGDHKNQREPIWLTYGYAPVANMLKGNLYIEPTASE